LSANGNRQAPFVQLTGVSKWFGHLQVLDHVDLTVEEHNVVCLIGASGSGKSTLLRCLNRLEHVQEGEILVDGQRLTDHNIDVNALRKKIGIVFQAFNLFPHMTVLQNVMLAPRKATGASRDQAEARARALLKRIGLEEKDEEFPDRLSGGQQQRVAIVLSLVRELADSGMTMIVATHEMGFAREVADKVCFLDNGIILEEGPPDQMFTSPREPRTREFLARVLEAEKLG